MVSTVYVPCVCVCESVSTCRMHTTLSVYPSAKSFQDARHYTILLGYEHIKISPFSCINVSSK